MRVAVLGGGLQGACVAMELASAGVSVDVYDRNERLLTQASVNNEGKIHLGYVYANDRTLRTARTMIRGGLAFAPLMRRWLGHGLNTVPVSQPFDYLVHRDSLLGPGEVEAHLLACHAIGLEEASGSRADYFGADAGVAPERLSQAELESRYDTRSVAAAFATPEIGIDPETLGDMVSARLSSEPRIASVLEAHVHGVAEENGGATVEFELGGSRLRERYDHVVNALWDGRLAVDETAGVLPERPWTYRVKRYLRVTTSKDAPPIPSATVVLGPFGDAVSYGNGQLYLSWYPAGLASFSSDVRPPSWPAALDRAATAELRTATVRGLAGVVPAVAALQNGGVESYRVQGGVIFAWGETDIDDPDSGLHDRYAIGPHTRGRYHTVDTGKLTMAPLFGKAVADRILQIG